MKKLILLMLLIPCFLFGDVIKDYKKEYSYLNKFRIESQIKFKIKKDHEYVFNVILRKNTQYCFIGEGKKDFHFQLIKPGDKEGWEGLFSRNNRIINLQDIYEGGIYIIKVHSFTDNFITLYWGEY